MPYCSSMACVEAGNKDEEAGEVEEAVTADDEVAMPAVRVDGMDEEDDDTAPELEPPFTATDDETKDAPDGVDKVVETVVVFSPFKCGAASLADEGDESETMVGAVLGC